MDGHIIDEKISRFQNLLLEIQQKIVTALWKLVQDGEPHLLEVKAKLIENFLIQIGDKIENGSIFDEIRTNLSSLFHNQNDIKHQIDSTSTSNKRLGICLDKELKVVLERLSDDVIKYHQDVNAKRTFRHDKSRKINSRSRSKKYSCTKCTRIKYFTSMLKLKCHIRRHHKDKNLKKPINCRIDKCNQLSYSHEDYLQHIEDAHTNCSKCSLKFSKRCDLINHLKTEHDTSHLYSCQKCPKKFLSRVGQVKHYRVDHCKGITETEMRKIKIPTIINKIGGHKCSYEGCTERFTLMKDLNQHRHSVHKIEIFKCSHPKCPRLYSTSKNMREHYRKVHLNGITKTPEVKKMLMQTPSLIDLYGGRKCSYEGCNERFTIHNDLNQHRNEVHGIETFKCSKCHQHYSTRKNLRLHYEKTHVGRVVKTHIESESDSVIKSKKVGGLKCTFEKCFEGFALMTDLNQHRKEAHDIEVFKCSTCNRYFSTRATLRSHRQNMHGEPVGRLICDFENCTESFPGVNATVFEIHKLSHKIQDLESCMKQKTCPICKLVIVNKSKLKDHIIRHEKGTNHFQCQDCGKIFNVNATLIRHRKSQHDHSGDPDVKRYQCEKCGAGLKSLETLRNHTRKLHGDFTCSYPECTFRSTSQKGIDKHFESSHKEINLCPICSVVCVDKYKLSLHIYRKHAEFKCTAPDCSEVFKTEVNLNKHMAEVHDSGDSTKFICQSCGHNSWTKKNLSRHTRENHGIPLKCPVFGCDKVFQKRYSRRAHIKTHNKIVSKE